MANEFIIKNGFHSKGNSQVTGSLTATSFSGDGSALTNLPASSVLTSSYTSEWVLGADGTDHYTFSGPGLTGAENDPDIYLVRGQKYRFYNNSGGHPFRIQSTPNGSAGTAYNDGVTNNDAGNGTYLLFDVQFDAPTKLYYQCTSHGDMGGPIYIADAIEHSGSFSGSFQGDGSSLTGISAGTNLTQSLFVSPSGNNGTAVVGNMSKPFATILAATASANIGDTIFVYPGTYLRETANIVKDGVNYYFYPGAHVTGSSPFIDATLTNPVNIRGYGKFETSYNGVQMSLSAPEGYFEFDRIIGKGVLSGGSNKHILNLEQTGNDTQVLTTMGTVTNVDSTSDSSAAVSFNGGNLIFKGNAINSGSEGYGVKISDDSTDVIIEGYIYSANGTAYYDNARNINTIVRGRIETGDESNFNAIYIHDGYSQGAHFDADIRGSIDIDTGEVSSGGVIMEGFQFCNNSPSSVGAIKVSGGYNIFNQKIIAKENIFIIENGHNIFNGQVNIINNSSGKMFDIQGGTLVFNGIGGDINHRVTSNTISGGTLIINNYLEHYGSSSPDDTDMFDLSGGTLEINNKIKYFQDTDNSGIVNMTGGYLKLNGAQLIHNDPSSANHCILLNNSSHSGSIFNNSFTNIPVVFQSGSFTNEITGGGTLFYSDKLY